MNHMHAAAMVLLLILSPVVAAAQDPGAKPDSKPQSKPKPADEGGKGDTEPPPTTADPDFAKKVTDIVNALKKTEDSDFGIVLGLGSLLVGPEVSDYTNDSNVLHATNVGRATPQLLTGLSFRTHIPGFVDRCKQPAPPSATGQPTRVCDEWLEHPWSAFVSLKFSPGSSQIIDGYVLGGSFAVARYDIPWAVRQPAFVLKL